MNGNGFQPPSSWDKGKFGESAITSALVFKQRRPEPDKVFYSCGTCRH